MNRTLQFLQWLILTILLLSLLMVGWLAVQRYQLQQVNAFIADPRVDAERPDDVRAHFALAALLAKQEDKQAALNEWTAVIAEAGQTELGAAAYFNRGNINLTQAKKLSVDNTQLIPLVELAKQDYRTALSIDSSLMDARYNLELALRLVPEQPNPDADFEKDVLSRQHTIESKGFRVDLP